MYEASITIRALHVTDLHNGHFRVELPSRPLGQEAAAMLRELFPNTIEQVYDLLTNEMLLAAVVRRDEEPRDEMAPNIAVPKGKKV